VLKIDKIMGERCPKQVEAADLFGVRQPRPSDRGSLNWRKKSRWAEVWLWKK
jgi:hypothetical protein